VFRNKLPINLRNNLHRPTDTDLWTTTLLTT